MGDGAGKLKRVTKTLNASQFKEIVFRRVCRLSTRRQALIWGAGGFLSVLKCGRRRSYTGMQSKQRPHRSHRELWKGTRPELSQESRTFAPRHWAATGCRMSQGRGCHLGRSSSLWLRGIPGDGFSCEPSAAITPGCWEVLKGRIWVTPPRHPLQRTYKDL